MGKPNTAFETETCGRCGGCGQYSYNQVNGSTCFGCGGSGVRYTKRGEAASKFFAAAALVPLSALKVGDVIQINTLTAGLAPLSYYAPVVAIEQRDGWPVTVWTESDAFGRYGFTGRTNGQARRRLAGAEREEALAAALAYQETLTKAGTPRKRPA